MRSLIIFFFISTAFLFFALFFHNIIEFDQDLGRHLLMGKIILETQSVPQVNLLAYTHPDFPFINSHWLSEVIFYLIGVPGILYFKVVVLGTACLLTVHTAYRYSKNLAATAVAFAVFVPVLLERTEIRPEMFTYLFAALFGYVLLVNKRLIWFLPLIQLFWVNMHVYFILGPVLVLIFALINRRGKALWIILAVSSVVCLINPNGIAGAIYPLKVFDNYGYSIVENQNIFFLAQVTNNPNIIYFWIAAVVFGISFFCSKKITALNLLLSLLIVLPVLHIRSFPVLFLILLPVLAFNLGNFRFKTIKPEYIIAGVILLTIWRGFRLVTNDYYLSIDSHKRFGNEVSESGKGAADFVLANDLSGPIFNNFDIGSYLDYRFYPDEKVFVDGRPEAYPAEFFRGVYIPMQMSTENFNKIDEIYKFKTIIFAHTDGTPWAGKFLSEIIKNPNWHLAYLDFYAAVFTNKKFKQVEVLGKNYLEHAALGNANLVFGRQEEARRYFQMMQFQKPKTGMVWF